MEPSPPELVFPDAQLGDDEQPTAPPSHAAATPASEATPLVAPAGSGASAGSPPSHDASAEAGPSSLPSASDLRDPPVPRLITDTSVDSPDKHRHFGLAALRSDISDMQSGTVPVSMLIATVIGIFCGVAAWLYYAILEFLLRLFWEQLPELVFHAIPTWLVPECMYWVWIPIVGLACAFLVGYSIKVLGFPGDLPYTIKCVHEEGYVPVGHAPSMVAASQVSIVGGGSLGPEAPIVAICASISGWVSMTLFKQQYKNVVRKHTLCGMACALAAFFGVPLGGSLFALEINHRLGYEYFEHALEAIASGTVCLVVFRSLAGLPIGPIYFFTDNLLAESSGSLVVIGALIGLLGAGTAALFAQFHWWLVKKLNEQGIDQDPVKLSMFGGIGIVVLGVLVPQTMFWGEFEMQTIGALSGFQSLPHIFPKGGLTNFEITGFFSAVIVGVTKLIAISFTVAGGYRGGFIFPFFATGAALGRALCFLFPSLPPVVSVLSFAAGINVAITRTALATPLILCGLAGEVNATPPVLAASLVSLFATYYMPFIKTQQGREDLFEGQLHSYTFKGKWGTDGESPLVKTRDEAAADVEAH